MADVKIIEIRATERFLGGVGQTELAMRQAFLRGDTGISPSVQAHYSAMLKRLAKDERERMDGGRDEETHLLDENALIHTLAQRVRVLEDRMSLREEQDVLDALADTDDSGAALAEVQRVATMLDNMTAQGEVSLHKTLDRIEFISGYGGSFAGHISRRDSDGAKTVINISSGRAWYGLDAGVSYVVCNDLVASEISLASSIAANGDGDYSVGYEFLVDPSTGAPSAIITHVVNKSGSEWSPELDQPIGSIIIWFGSAIVKDGQIRKWNQWWHAGDIYLYVQNVPSVGYRVSLYHDHTL